jgi:putative membrane protein
MSMRASQPRQDKPPLLAAVACLAAAIWSLIGATDIGVWAFEVLPLGLGILLVGLFSARLPLTRLTYSMLAVGFIMQCVGGRYTFSAVPLPDGFVEGLGLTRNPIDRVGHVLQGFISAVFLRDVVLRRTSLPPGWWLAALITGTCLGFSAFYELAEAWMVIAFYPDAGPEWLGTQGDPWDAQWDMTMALVGAIAAQLLLGAAQDRALHARS